MSVSTQRVLVILLYVCQHADDLVMTVCLSAHRWYWWYFCVSVSMQMRLMMHVSVYQQMEDIHNACICLSAYRWYWCWPASVYEQLTADSFGRYIAHLIFGNSNGGRLLNPLFCTKKLGTIGYQCLYHQQRTERLYPSETEGLIIRASCFAISKGVLKGTSVLFQTWIKYSAKHHPKLLVFQSKLYNSLTATTAFVDSLVYMA
jgi:hypothetical protein